MDKINVKILAIVIAIIAIIGIVFFLIIKPAKNDKSYVLEKIAEEDYKYFAVLADEKYGVIDTKGQIIIENKYNKIIIPNPTKDVFIVTNEDETTDVLNKDSQNLFTEFKNVQAIEINSSVSNLPYEKSVLKYEENGKYGLLDFSGKKLTDAIYEEISSVNFKEGEILAKRNDKYGVINNKGTELIAFDYDQIEGDKYYNNGNYLKSGYIVKRTTNEGYRYGYISSNWEELIDTEYTSVSRILDKDDTNDIYLIVSKNGRYGVIKNKNVIIDFIYQGITYNKETNLFAVQRGGQYGVLNIEGKTILNVEYKSIKFNGIYIYAKSYTEDLYFNKNGEKQDNTYTSMIKTKEGSYVTVNKQNLYGIVNENGQETVKNEYLYIEYAFDNYFIAYKPGKGLGVIDKSGKTYIDFKYDVLSKIGDNKLLKGINMKNDVTDIYSSEMKEITSLSNATLELKNDYIELYNEKANHYITKNGELKNEKEILTDNKLFAINKENKWGFEDKEGNIKVECIYDYVTEFNRFGFAGVKLENKWGVIDENRRNYIRMHI